jgi:hypothetical protein
MNGIDKKSPALKITLCLASIKWVPIDFEKPKPECAHD